MILSPIEGGRLVAAGQRCKDNYEPVVHCGEAELQQSQMGRGRGVGKSILLGKVNIPAFPGQIQRTAGDAQFYLCSAILLYTDILRRDSWRGKGSRAIEGRQK